MDSFTQEATKIMINHKGPSVEISDSEAEYLNSLPLENVVDALKNIFDTTSDIFTESRAFDALLKLQNFDKVGFIIELYDNSGVEWRCVCCRYLQKFWDSRAVEKLAEIVRNDPDPDVRYEAAVALAEIGDLSIVDALEIVSATDDGIDYGGFRVADMAKEALRKIHVRTGFTE